MTKINIREVNRQPETFRSIFLRQRGKRVWRVEPRAAGYNSLAMSGHFDYRSGGGLNG
jgi:hypothetical protein